MTQRPRGPVDGAVLVPVKAFDQAKVRLSPALDEGGRARLARRMATRVVEAQHDLPVAVCCDAPEVAEWAEGLGAQVVWCPGTGLNGAVQRGAEQLRADGYGALAVAHSDLPLAASLRPLLGWPGVTLVPDRHRTGTNVIALPTSIDFEFRYGVGSFTRHVRESVRHRRGVRICHDRSLGWDVDHPADLELADADLLATLLSAESDR